MRISCFPNDWVVWRTIVTCVTYLKWSCADKEGGGDRGSGPPPWDLKKNWLYSWKIKILFGPPLGKKLHPRLMIAQATMPSMQGHKLQKYVTYVTYLHNYHKGYNGRPWVAGIFYMWHTLLTYTIITKATMWGPGWPEYFTCNIRYLPTQLSQRLQCEALGGRNILHATYVTYLHNYHKGYNVRPWVAGIFYMWHTLLTYTIITKATMGGPGWPEYFTSEAVFQLDHLTSYNHLLCTRGRSVCRARHIGIWDFWNTKTNVTTTCIFTFVLIY